MIALSEFASPLYIVNLAQLLFTPGAKNVLECAVVEATALGHTHIGSEHLLLGLFCEGKGVAATVLLELGLQLDEVREKVVEFLNQDLPAERETALVAPSEQPEPLILPSSSLELTRQGVKRRLAELRKIIAGNTQTDHLGLLGDTPKLQGKIVALEEVLAALPKDEEILGLVVAIRQCHFMMSTGRVVEKMKSEWEGGTLSDEEFIARINHLRREQEE